MNHNRGYIRRYSEICIVTLNVHHIGFIFDKYFTIDYMDVNLINATGCMLVLCPYIISICFQNFIHMMPRVYNNIHYALSYSQYSSGDLWEHCEKN